MLSTQTDPLPLPPHKLYEYNTVLIDTGKGGGGVGEPMRRLEVL